jgi:hypothetical protein
MCENWQFQDVGRSEPHETLQKFRGTYSSGHVPIGYTSQLAKQPLIQVHYLFVNWFVCFTYLLFSVF